MTGAAEGHGDARLEHVAQPLEDDAQRIVAEGKEHRAARLRAAVVTDRQIQVTHIDGATVYRPTIRDKISYLILSRPTALRPAPSGVNERSAGRRTLTNQIETNARPTYGRQDQSTQRV